MSSRRPSRLERLFSHRPVLLGGPLAAVLLAATPAAAQTVQDAPSNCPPGSWFCASAEKPATPPPPVVVVKPSRAPVTVTVEEKGALEPLPPAEAAPPPPPPPPPPPVVVYRRPPPPPVVLYAPPPPPPPYYYYRARPPKPLRTGPEWGLNLRAEGALQGSGSASTRAMTGVGFALRYRPAPAFAVEAGFDFLGGNDYNNNPRNETEFTVNALVFLNPRSRVQLYLLAGLGGAWAHVTDQSSYDYQQLNYTYFGGQGGAGLEFRIAKHFAMNLDARAFIRSRTDSSASYTAEYTNPQTGQTTNTSDGMLITAGMTFYF
jgi:opacity protein-like surface antigen